MLRGQGSHVRLLTAIVLVVVFGSGILLGVAWERSRGATPSAEATAEDGGAQDGERRVPMYEQVGPTPDQKILIDSIVRDHRRAMQALHQEFRDAYDPRYRALIEETREAIKGVFTPEQAITYDSLLARYDQRRRERSENDRD